MADAISNTIALAKISQILSEKEIVVGSFSGNSKLDTRHPRLLRMGRRSLEYLYAQNPSSPDLTLIGNYVLSLCGKYLFKAKQLLALSGGVASGIIVNPKVIVAPKIKIITGSQIVNGYYIDADYYNYRLIIQLNGVRTLLPSEYNDAIAGGGFQLLLPGTFGSSDYFVITPNGQ